jgi:hypothetical protein
LFTQIFCSSVLTYVRYSHVDDQVSGLLPTENTGHICLRSNSELLSLSASFIGSLSTTLLNPFDVKYDVLLRRWTQHQSLVELEMQFMTNKVQAEALVELDSMMQRFVTEGAFEETKMDIYKKKRDPGTSLRKVTTESLLIRC